MATSTPLTFYFLSFLNFINFSTLYILLNITIPEQTFDYLSTFYFSINTNFLQLVDKAP